MSTSELIHQEALSVPVEKVSLTADLLVPDRARALVLFAHGSGSGRRSLRNRFVAEYLRKHQLGTLLLDLLTGAKAAEDSRNEQFRFDIPRLAARLSAVTDWVRFQSPLGQLPIGYFGASTGAAAALIAAAEQDKVVRAVVSRGGRPDLASEALERVRAPTLLIVGGADPAVLELNRAALLRMRTKKQLSIVPRATHLFEEPGALDQVAQLSAAWFIENLFNRDNLHKPPP